MNSATRMVWAVVCLTMLTFNAASSLSAQEAAVKQVGTIKNINGSTVTLATDAGTEINVILAPGARLLKAPPAGQSLKDAAPLQIQDLQAGDRMLARGSLAADGKAVVASTAVIMKQAEIAQKQEQERQDWQKRGVGGLVTAVDEAAGTVTISTLSSSGTKNSTVKLAKETVIRRYASGSVRFDDAKPGTLSQIKVGDQLRARGKRNEDGTEMAAEEVVSGAFRNIAGTISTTDAASNSLTVMDLATKKPVTVRVTSDSQMKKLPEMLAQRLAIRLKGGAPDAQSAQRPATGAAGGAPRQAGAPDLQQILNRMPAVSIADMKKGDAVMIVSSAGTNEVTAITLLTGVEPILTASPNGGAMLLSPWNLGSVMGDAGAQ